MTAGIRGEASDLLRLYTCGSVDDGKSTLIGRLLHDSGRVLDDQLVTLRRETARYRGEDSEHDIDLALLVDGLETEREQRITVDVAYRYFSSARRRFILADSPGHEEYTRNMVTAASNSEVAVILVDAERGIQSQTRRHAFIAAAFAIPDIVVAVNKMDRVAFSETRFSGILTRFAEMTADFQLPRAQFIPVSALRGDNVVYRSNNMSWYRGHAILECLENLRPMRAAKDRGFRMPVQLLLRDGARFVAAGTIASGTVRVGDTVVMLPSGQTTTVERVEIAAHAANAAHEGVAITISIDPRIVLERGDMLSSPDDAPTLARRFEATVVWMSGAPLDLGRDYLAMHTTATTMVRAVRLEASGPLLPKRNDRLALNEVARITFETQRPLVCDTYEQNRTTGSLILVDPSTNETAGAAMISAIG